MWQQEIIIITNWSTAWVSCSAGLLDPPLLAGGEPGMLATGHFEISVNPINKSQSKLDLRRIR
jgi:hypothetical protein